MKLNFIAVLILLLNAQKLGAQKLQFNSKVSERASLISKQDSVRKLKMMLPTNFATCQYGFFCKNELKFEKQTKLPLKFRVGTLEQCNWLEGKIKYKPIQ